MDIGRTQTLYTNYHARSVLNVRNRIVGASLLMYRVVIEFRHGAREANLADD